MDDIFRNKKRNEELLKALSGHSDKRLKKILANGDYINRAVNENRDTMLHEAKTQSEVYLILRCGADANARNIQGKTPLHTAAETGKHVFVIEELIDRGADVNAVDMHGNLPLNYAVRRIKKDYNVIKVLVMKGSLVMQRRNAFDLNHATGQPPLSDALLMNDIECVRLLIKYHVLHGQGLLIPPNPNNLVEYIYHRRYNYMRDYFYKCCFQLLNMRNEVVHKPSLTTLHNVLQHSLRSWHVLYFAKAMDSFANRCLWLVRSLKYSVYNDVILSQLEKIIDHRCIKNQIRELEIYACVDQVWDVSSSADKKNTENDNNCNKITNDQQKILSHMDKEHGSSPVSKEWEMESYQSVSNTDVHLNVDVHKNACTKLSSSQNDCAFAIGYQPQGFNIRCHKKVDQPQIDNLKEELNANDVYDIGAEFNEDDYQPQKLFINHDLNLDDVIDIGAEYNENGNQPQNVIHNEKLKLDSVNDIGAEYNENANQPQNAIQTEKLNLDSVNVISTECNENANQPPNVILNDKLNLEDVIDIGAGFNENVDQPQMDILNKKLPRAYSHDLEEGVEMAAESQSTEDKERKLSKRVVLNEYCVTTVAGYLSKNYLFNWFVAYYIPENIPEVDEEKSSIDRLRNQILKRAAEKPPSQPHKVTKFC